VAKDAVVGAERVWRAMRVLRSVSVVTSMREAHGTRVCGPAEEWWIAMGESNAAPGVFDVKRSAL